MTLSKVPATTIRSPTGRIARTRGLPSVAAVGSAGPTPQVRAGVSSRAASALVDATSPCATTSRPMTTPAARCRILDDVVDLMSGTSREPARGHHSTPGAGQPVQTSMGARTTPGGGGAGAYPVGSHPGRPRPGSRLVAAALRRRPRDPPGAQLLGDGALTGEQLGDLGVDPAVPLGADPERRRPQLVLDQRQLPQELADGEVLQRRPLGRLVRCRLAGCAFG